MVDIFEALQHGFIQKAIITGIFLSLCSSILGIFLVLRKQSLISDGLSHVSFASVAFALFAGASPLAVSIPIVIFASFLIYKLTKVAGLYGDAAIGLVSATSMGLGVLVISISSGFNLDIYSYLFGSILAVSNLEVVLSIAISLVVISVLFLYFQELYLMTYDEEYARISGINISLMNLIFVILQSVTIVIGVKIVGAMLISSLIIFPAVTSLQVVKNFRGMILFSAVFSLVSVTGGIIISTMADFPSGATIVCINALMFSLVFIVRHLQKN